MKIRVQKRILTLLLLLLVASFLGIISPANAQPSPDRCFWDPTFRDRPECQAVRESANGVVDPANCNNPSYTLYNSQECIRYRLGFDDLDLDVIVIPRDPNSLIVVGFRIVLSIIVLLTIARVLWVSFQLGQADMDGEKRKEKILSLVWILVSMLVALAGLGLTFAVQEFVFGETFEDQLIKCSDLPPNASQELIDRCNAVII
jgi:hypothetical protein